MEENVHYEADSIDNVNLNQSQNQQPNPAWWLLAFFVPVAGFVLYLVFKNKKPTLSKYLGKPTLIGAIVWSVIGTIYFILNIFFLSNTLSVLLQFITNFFNSITENGNVNYPQV